MALAPSLIWLFVGRLISGITSASISTAYAYIADVTPGEKRAGRFGLLGVAFGVGFVLGPALGGLAGNVSPRLPFWIAAALSLANALYGFLVLPESLAVERRAPACPASASSTCNIASASTSAWSASRSRPSACARWWCRAA